MEGRESATVGGLLGGVQLERLGGTAWKTRGNVLTHILQVQSDIFKHINKDRRHIQAQQEGSRSFTALVLLKNGGGRQTKGPVWPRFSWLLFFTGQPQVSKKTTGGGRTAGPTDTDGPQRSPFTPLANTHTTLLDLPSHPIKSVQAYPSRLRFGLGDV